MTSLPRAILFDLDETLISFGRRPLLLQETAEQFAAELAPLNPAEVAQKVEQAYRVFWSDEARHKIWRFRLEEARVKVVADVFEELRDRAPAASFELAREFGERFHLLREAQAAFFPGAMETLRTFRRLGVRLALVTNGDAATQRAKVEKFELAPHFEHIQIEGEHGFGKPEERAYLHAMQSLGVAAPETWMVGDNLEWEVAAPQRLGIYAIWHDHLGAGLPPDSQVRPDRIIRSLGELTEGL